MKFDDLWPKARTLAERDVDHMIDDEIVVAIVKATVEGLGFHVANDGEICDPRPKPSPSYPQQQNARWRGSRRR